MDIIYNVIFYAIEHIKYFLIYKSIMKLPVRKNRSLYLAVLLGSIIMALTYVFLDDRYKFVTYVLLVCIETTIFVKEKIYKSLIIGFWSMCVVTSLDSIIMGCINMFLLIFNYSKNVTMLSESIGTIITILILIILSFISKQKYNYTKIHIKYYLIFTVIAAANSMILALLPPLINQNSDVNYKVIIFAIYTLVTIGVYVQLVLIMYLAMSKNVYKERDILNKKYLKMEEQHFLYLDNREQETRQFRHDIRGHMDSIRTLYDAGQYNELGEYINCISEKMESSKLINVNLGVANAILNQYAALCEKREIDLEVKGHFPLEFNIELFDICTILSNIMSNAVEATEKCEKKKILVDIRYEERRKLLSIMACNTYIGNIQIEKGKLLTNKKDKENHGYGITNITQSIMKYDGDLNIDANEEIFTINIMLKNY